MAHRTPCITGFGDAVAVALGLWDDYDDAHLVVALDREGTPLDAMHCAGEHTVRTALGWAWCQVHDDDRIAWLLALSAVTDTDLRTLRDDDVATFREERQAFAELGVELRDWILTNGDDIRSMAFSCLLDAVWDQAQ